MYARNKARKSGHKNLYKKWRNIATKLIKHDHIQGVIARIGNKPDSRSAWQEAKVYLGKGHGTTLPECTTNTDPQLTAEQQNEFFIGNLNEENCLNFKIFEASLQIVVGSTKYAAQSSHTA